MKLSKKEKVRAEKSAKRLQKMQSEGHKVKEVTISPGFANTMGMVWGIILFIPLVLLFINKFGDPFSCPEESWDFIVTQVLYILLIVIHEGIHGVCMYLFNGHDKSTIEFGINSGMPYCTCQAPIKRWQYIIVLLMPTIILGIATSILALQIGRFWWLLLAFEMMVGGGGDLTITSKILMEKVNDLSVVDHPYKCGFFSLSKAHEVDDLDRILKEINDAQNEEIEAEDPTKDKKSPKTSTLVAIFLIVVAFWIGWLVGAIFGYEDAMAEIEAENTIATEATEIRE